MARRSKSKSNSKSHFVVYLIIAAAVIGALIAGKFILGKQAQAYSNISELSISDVQDGATSLSGNTYRVSGKITQKEKWTPDSGQLIGVFVDQGEKGSGNIPIFVPAGVDKINLTRGQSYTFKVKIDRAGLPIAIEMKAK